MPVHVATGAACFAAMSVIHTALFSVHAGCIVMEGWAPRGPWPIMFAGCALACAAAIYGRRNRRDEELLAAALFATLGGGALVLSPEWRLAGASCPTVMDALSIGAVAVWFAWSALVACATFLA